MGKVVIPEDMTPDILEALTQSAIEHARTASQEAGHASRLLSMTADAAKKLESPEAKFREAVRLAREKVGRFGERIIPMLINNSNGMFKEDDLMPK